MKNPLVDALRQASGSAAPADQSEPAVEDAVAVNEPEIADPGELQLMVSTGVFPDEDAGILPIDGANDADGDDVDAEFYETGSLQIANEDEETAVAQPTDPVPYPPALHSGKRSGVPRLGYYSPLICLAFAVAAAGYYFVYQKVTGWHQNSDLAALSTQIEMSAEQSQAQTTGSEGVESRFKLIVGPQPAKRNDVQAYLDNDTESLVR